jgi:hypothetical protein
MLMSFASFPPNVPAANAIATITVSQAASVRHGCTAQARAIRARAPVWPAGAGVWLVFMTLLGVRVLRVGDRRHRGAAAAGSHRRDRRA